MVSIDLDALEATARAATPGPWLIGNSEMYGPSAITRDAEGLPQVQDQWVCDADAGHPNAEHIATFDPPTVLALIARLREAEAVIAEIGSLEPMWPRGMYGCPQDMFGRNQIRAILSRYKPTNQEGT